MNWLLFLLYNYNTMGMNNTANKDNNDYNVIYEMALVGYFGNKRENNASISQKYKVFVNGSEGSIPHFHIWDDATNGKEFHTCICIKDVEYFHHTGKEGVLNSNQKEKLMEFLKKEPQNKRYRNHWEYICSMWNDNNGTQTYVDENSDIPDYTKLK